MGGLGWWLRQFQGSNARQQSPPPPQNTHNPRRPGPPPVVVYEGRPRVGVDGLKRLGGAGLHVVKRGLVGRDDAVLAAGLGVGGAGRVPGRSGRLWVFAPAAGLTAKAGACLGVRGCRPGAGGAKPPRQAGSNPPTTRQTECHTECQTRYKLQHPPPTSTTMLQMVMRSSMFIDSTADPANSMALGGGLGLGGVLGGVWGVGVVGGWAGGLGSGIWVGVGVRVGVGLGCFQPRPEGAR